MLKRRKGALDAILARKDKLIVTNRNELDAVYNGPQALQRLREQVRHKNLCGGVNIKISGNKKELYERLLQHVDGPSSA